MRSYRKQFTVDRLSYVVDIDIDGDVSFALIGGGTRRGMLRAHPLWPDERKTIADVDLLVGNPLRVFHTVAAIVLAWAMRERPHVIQFCPTTRRRLPIYRWLARRAAPRLPGYWHYELGGRFYFFRAVGPVGAAGVPADTGVMN